MAIEFKLPDIGEGIAEGEIVKWLVNAGDAVEEHQPVVEVMTDKATVELPAPAAGRVTEFLAAEGDVVPVGQVLFRLETGESEKGGDSSDAGSKEAGRGSSSKQAEPKAPAKEATKEKPRAEQPQRKGAQAAPEGKSKAPSKRSAGRTLEFKLPDIGEGIAEGEIVKWLANEGDVLEEHQPVVEVMTDKATVELPAPAAGTLSKILAQAGEVVPVGQVIFELETGSAGEAAQEGEPTGGERGDARAPERPSAQRAERPSERAPAEESPRGRARPAPAGNSAGKVLAVPSARRVARELGIDLAEVAGSGRGGVIRRKDVEAHAEAGAAEPQRAAAPESGAKAPERKAPRFLSARAERSEERIPFRGVRRKIAEAMTRSKFTAPHFTVVEELDVTELVALRNKAKALGEAAGVKITYMPFIMKATALALAKFPMLNGRLDEEANELVRPDYADLGIATDTPNGLVVPVIRDVQAKGVLQLAAELFELAERTRAGRVKPEELRGSTFSITNAGNIGGILATPIINFPDIAILGVHRMRKAPGVVETPQGDRIEVRQYMNLSLSVDHRLADGADGARMLVYMKQLLESPGLLAL